jgi:hypothetical protein
MKSWAVPAAIIVAVEYLVALLLALKVGFHYRIPFGVYAITGASIASIGIALFIVVKLISYAMHGEQRPRQKLLSDLPKCAGFVVGTLLVSVQISVLTWTKIMLPIAAPFWADPLLANLDHAIFRTDPWRIAEVLFGWASPLIDMAYVTWAPIKFATLIAVLPLPESRTKTRILVAYFLIMASAALGQYFMSSAGPIFYSQLGLGDRFAALPVEPWVATTASYLWRDYLRAGGDIGGGISAMPSLHVGIALWFALVIRAYLPRLAFIGFVYFGLILVGSILLGWHYAADGFVAIVIVVVAWRVAAAAANVGNSYGGGRDPAELLAAGAKGMR